MSKPPTSLVTEFPVLTARSTPMEIVAGPDGALWFSDPGANKIGRITVQGQITEFALPTNSEPGAITSGPDGALWFSEPGTAKIGRITVQGGITEFALPTGEDKDIQPGTVYIPGGITAGPDGALWFSAWSPRIGRLSLRKPS